MSLADRLLRPPRGLGNWSNPNDDDYDPDRIREAFLERVEKALKTHGFDFRHEVTGGADWSVYTVWCLAGCGHPRSEHGEHRLVLLFDIEGSAQLALVDVKVDAEGETELDELQSWDVDGQEMTFDLDPVVTAIKKEMRNRNR